MEAARSGAAVRMKRRSWSVFEEEDVVEEVEAVDEDDLAENDFDDGTATTSESPSSS